MAPRSNRFGLKLNPTPDATIKISREELDRVGQPSIALKDGSGYIAELGVFHELHCLVRLFCHL